MLFCHVINIYFVFGLFYFISFYFCLFVLSLLRPFLHLLILIFFITMCPFNSSVNCLVVSNASTVVIFANLSCNLITMGYSIASRGSNRTKAITKDRQGNRHDQTFYVSPFNNSGQKTFSVKLYASDPFVASSNLVWSSFLFHLIPQKLMTQI